jgi:hypothetical protein
MRVSGHSNETRVRSTSFTRERSGWDRPPTTGGSRHVDRTAMLSALVGEAHGGAGRPSMGLDHRGRKPRLAKRGRSQFEKASSPSANIPSTSSPSPCDATARLKPFPSSCTIRAPARSDSPGRGSRAASTQQQSSQPRRLVPGLTPSFQFSNLRKNLGQTDLTSHSGSKRRSKRKACFKPR